MTLVLFAVIGLLVAAAAFFLTFVTTQKAFTPHPRKNLILTIPSDPPRPTLDALPSSTSIFVNPSPTAIATSSPALDSSEETEPTL